MTGKARKVPPDGRRCRETASRQHRVHRQGQPRCRAWRPGSPFRASQFRVARDRERQGGADDRRFGRADDGGGSPERMPGLAGRHTSTLRQRPCRPDCRSPLSGFRHGGLAAGAAEPLQPRLGRARGTNGPAPTSAGLRHASPRPYRQAPGRALVRRHEPQDAGRGQHGALPAAPDHERRESRRPCRHRPGRGRQVEPAPEDDPFPVRRRDRPASPDPGPARGGTALRAGRRPTSFACFC